MDPALIRCLQATPEAQRADAVGDWLQQWRSVGDVGATPASMAVAGGFAADRVGWAFASGYQAALRAMLPELPREALVALCVTEAEGNRPRHIRTSIARQPDGHLRVDGSKRWTTLGSASTELLIVGTISPSPRADKPVLGVVRVALPAQGLVLHPMPTASFVPEVPHAQVTMEDVRVNAGALLPQDGYNVYVKPFGTLEDLFVTLAVLAYLLREGRARDWPAEFNEGAFATLSLLFRLAEEDVGAASTHIALAGALRAARRLYAEASLHWAAGEDSAALRWRRDTALFNVATAAREQRAVRAWQSVLDGNP